MVHSKFTFGTAKASLVLLERAKQEYRDLSSAIQNPVGNKKTVTSACLGGLSKERGRCIGYLQETARMTVLLSLHLHHPQKKKFKN